MQTLLDDRRAAVVVVRPGKTLQESLCGATRRSVFTAAVVVLLGVEGNDGSKHRGQHRSHNKEQAGALDNKHCRWHMVLQREREREREREGERERGREERKEKDFI